MVAPLDNLRRKSVAWVWSSECEEAFLKAKQALLSPKVLAHYDPSFPLILACDASPVGSGAVVFYRYANGNERPVAFASRSPSSAERNYSQIEKEGLPIVFDLKKFHQYVFGHHFDLITDHKPLLNIFNHNKGFLLAIGRLQRWGLFVKAHNYTVSYRKSELLGNADGLSRPPVETTDDDSSTGSDVDAIMAFHIKKMPVSSDDVKASIAESDELSTVREYIRNGWSAKLP